MPRRALRPIPRVPRILPAWLSGLPKRDGRGRRPAARRGACRAGSSVSSPKEFETMTALIPCLIAGTVLVSYQQPTRQEAAMDQAAAATYEHLATAIIEIRETEDSLVR